MWFKNLRIYRITQPLTLPDAETLQAQLAEQRFSPCARAQPYSLGWTAPLGEEASELSHRIGNNTLFCLKREEKILPSSVIKDAVAEKVQQYISENDRPPSRKQQKQWQEDASLSLLPQAFTKARYCYGYLDLSNQLLIIDSSGRNQAEEFCQQLRQTLGSLPIVPLNTDVPLDQVMTGWLQEGIPQAPFALGHECELKDTQDDGVIRCRYLELQSDEVIHHIENGKQVVKLGLSWQEAIEFILQDDYSIKRLRYSDELKEKAMDVEAGDPLSQRDHEWSIMFTQLDALLANLRELISGKAEGRS